MLHVYPPKPWRRQALPVLRSPAGPDVGGCDILRWTMPAIASLEDLKAAQKDLLEARDLNELKAVFKKWRRIGWKSLISGCLFGRFEQTHTGAM